MKLLIKKTKLDTSAPLYVMEICNFSVEFHARRSLQR